MISEILDAKTCAECRFCCSFRRCSLWETPIFDVRIADKLKNKCNFKVEEINNGKGAVYDLSKLYKTEDAKEEVPCPFLDRLNGCTLDACDKPFDCKIWPFRVLEKDNKILIGLTPTCPAVNKLEISILQKFVKEKIASEIFEYVRLHKEIIKPFKESYIIMCYQEDK